MSDDNIAIQGAAPAAPGPITLIKTFMVVDPAGNTVEAQAVVMVDENGKVIQSPLTEATGRQILAALIALNNAFVESTNCGAYMAPPATPGSV